ncbi:hypothetical protein [Paratractidigestivibacter faecalis]|uniref:hypothetical protein n=1 Tax=Paratractidigestivibacter faecalis TaxID=2292441 RepID=UPI00388F8E93
MSLRAVVRVLFISSDTVDAFLASVTLEQVTACTSMLESEVAHCDRARRARLLKQARFPVSKSAEGFGWSNVPFPDGWGVRRCAPPYVRAWRRGPGLLWADEQGQDPHSHLD